MSEKTLRHKLFLAGKAAQEVKKNGDGDGFKYARAEDVLAEASRVLEKQSIVVIPSVEAVELRFLKNGGAIAKASMSFEVTDTKTGETFTKPWVGTGFDSPGDKAAYAAQTGAKKYFLASLLGIPFGTDPEEDTKPEDSQPSEAEVVRREQDAAAEEPDEAPTIKPLPESDLPEPDWSGIGLGDVEVGAGA
jgi:hypothetical protein